MKSVSYDDKYNYVFEILAKRGEISEKEIKSIPIFRNKNEYLTIMEALKYDPNVKIITKKVSDWPMLEWQRIFRFSP